MVRVLLLRAMQKAVYDVESRGHFGLALRHYCHFTSPIRRYPDLFIHRVIKEQIASRRGIPARRRTKLRSLAVEAAAQSSRKEQAAAETEREADRIKMAEYMLSHIGETFDAVISGVASFGIFAELENTVEGRIGLSDLDDDYYLYEPENLCLTGRLSGRRLRLGDRIRVVVKGASPEDGQVDFTPA
jgi:ribonuclease R